MNTSLIKRRSFASFPATNRSFTSFQMVHTHTHSEDRVRKRQAQPETNNKSQTYIMCTCSDLVCPIQYQPPILMLTKTSKAKTREWFVICCFHPSFLMPSMCTWDNRLIGTPYTYIYIYVYTHVYILQTSYTENHQKVSQCTGTQKQSHAPIGGVKNSNHLRNSRIPHVTSLGKPIPC